VLGAELTIQPWKKVIVTKPQWGGQGPNWAVEPYDDDDDGDLFVVYLTTFFSNVDYIASNERDDKRIMKWK
jgi:hypothetical protein